MSPKHFLTFVSRRPIGSNIVMGQSEDGLEKVKKCLGLNFFDRLYLWQGERGIIITPEICKHEANMFTFLFKLPLHLSMHVFHLSAISLSFGKPYTKEKMYLQSLEKLYTQKYDTIDNQHFRRSLRNTLSSAVIGYIW